MHPAAVSGWGNYYDETILSQEYLQSKEKIFSVFLNDVGPVPALDLGCNDGYFSKIMARKMPIVIASDFDESCINRLYLAGKRDKLNNILPLYIDITNPSPAIGFRNEERSSFLQRFHSELVVALALIHHLVLRNNIPFLLLAQQFATLTGKFLIVEFVPLADEKARQLIVNKTSFHQPYDMMAFEENFGRYFTIEHKEMISGTQRALYCMRKK